MADEIKNQKENQEEPQEEASSEQPSSEEGAKPKKKKLPLKLILIILGALVFLGGGAYLFLSGDEKKDTHKGDATKEQEISPEEIEYFDFPEILVNLRADSPRLHFLKADLVLEIKSKKDLETIEKLTPRLQDAFQVYLRELRPSDIRGPGSSDIIREALILRANKIIAPLNVHNILFKNFIVQ